MKAVVLAGGFGTRLRSRVSDVPKPLASIGGRPFIEYVLDRLVDAEIESITLSVGYRWQAFRDYLGMRYRDVPLHYRVETEPLGTGGAIADAIRTMGPLPTLVLNGDSYLELDIKSLCEWYAACPSPLALVLRSVPDTGRYGVALVDGETLVGFAEKAGGGWGLINTGVYVIDPAVMASYADGACFSFEEAVLRERCGELKPRVLISDGYFIDIGIPEDYDRACAEMPARR